MKNNRKERDLKREGVDWDIDSDRIYLDFLKELTEKELLGELLACIHGDGGHRTQEIGVAKATFEAIKLIEIIKRHTESLEERFKDKALANFYKGKPS